jgi:hypothetical protein
MSNERTNIPYHHAPDQHFEYLVDYLRHLVDFHDVEETPELWRSGREQFDAIHAELHGVDPSE